MDFGPQPFPETSGQIRNQPQRVRLREGAGVIETDRNGRIPSPPPWHGATVSEMQDRSIIGTKSFGYRDAVRSYIRCPI